MDAALDEVHRTAVANMVHRQAREAQYILTTFNPELVQVADKHYGVTFANKVSMVEVVDKSQALRFIEEQNRDK